MLPPMPRGMKRHATAKVAARRSAYCRAALMFAQRLRAAARASAMPFQHAWVQGACRGMRIQPRIVTPERGDAVAVNREVCALKREPHASSQIAMKVGRRQEGIR